MLDCREQLGNVVERRKMKFPLILATILNIFRPFTFLLQSVDFDSHAGTY